VKSPKAPRMKPNLLQVEASPSVVKACETIVRAHEACVVTLNTEYQARFALSPLLKIPTNNLQEEFPQSYALSTRPSPRPRPRRLWRATTAAERSARAIPMDRRWHRPCPIIRSTPALMLMSSSIRFNLYKYLYLYTIRRRTMGS